ncbi:glycosylphosphatidylinositol anchor biosynthesis [Elasticomyces elasticus]|nr:glycosylphosphatidylinositol anchor biosynthesis [Elasticomyces elasticus]
MSSSRVRVYTVFGLLLALRLVNALSVQTFFQPDEYFQSLEPAWQIAFGKDAGAWITWEWREHLRSSLHPMLFAAVYRGAAQLCDLLQIAEGSRTVILLAAPKIFQACIAAAGDFFTWTLACKLFGHGSHASFATLAMTAFSPWQFHCSVRTFSNSLETTLTIAALHYWPWQWSLFTRPPKVERPQSNTDLDTTKMVQQLKDFSEPTREAVTDTSSFNPAPNGLYMSLSLAAMACILRPTNIIIWAVIAICLLGQTVDLQKTITLLSSAVLCGGSVLAFTLSLDRAYYGEWVFPPFKFLYFNIVQAVSGFYGHNRVDYYFTEGLPLLSTTTLPFAAIGLWQSLRPGMDRTMLRGYMEQQTRFVLAVTIITTVLAMTMISHKEMRFIYPLLPMVHILAARPVASFFKSVPTNKVKLGFILFLLIINICIAGYVTLVHQRGVIDVMHYLRREQEGRMLGNGSNVTVGFLMPCHSTPWRSHLVYPEIKAWALTCEPPLNLSVDERRRYEDEADVFYNDPASWIDANLKDRKLISLTDSEVLKPRAGDEARRDWPEYLVFFEHLELITSVVLRDTRYQECWRTFNTHWHDDGRRRGDVVVWCIPRNMAG